MNEEKRCIRCSIVKSEGEFYRAKSGYLSSKCRKCQNEAQREWRQDNPERSREILAASYKKHSGKRKANEKLRRMLPEVKEKVKESLERRRFSQALSASRKSARYNDHRPCIASEQEIKAAFTGRCYVCGVPEVECAGKLHMDHCHETGEFRGWLCKNCNSAAGFLGDSPQIARILAEYIE